MDKVLVATRIEVKTHRMLKAIGEKEDRTVSYLLRKAVERYVEVERKQASKRVPTTR